jgi:hypothetical protein
VKIGLFSRSFHDLLRPFGQLSLYVAGAMMCFVIVLRWTLQIGQR